MYYIFKLLSKSSQRISDHILNSQEIRALGWLEHHYFWAELLQKFFNALACCSAGPDTGSHYIPLHSFLITYICSV